MTPVAQRALIASLLAVMELIWFLIDRERPFRQRNPVSVRFFAAQPKSRIGMI